MLLPSQVSKKSLDQLNKQQKSINNLQSDSLFIVEEILEVKNATVLVKWENYKVLTWESLSNMPFFIKKLIEKNGSGKIKIPNPIVKHEKIIDGCKHVLLEWTDETGETDVVWQAYPIHSAEEDFSCQTKKDKDKRLCR